MFVKFSLKPACIPPCVGKTFKFLVFTFLENALKLGIFTHVPSHSKFNILSSHPWQKENTHIPRQHFFKNMFVPTAEEVEKAVVCFI